MNFCQGAFGAIDTMRKLNASRGSYAFPELIKGFLCFSRTHQGIPMLFLSSSRDSYAFPKLIKGKAAKVSKGRPQSPLVASAEAKPSAAYEEMKENYPKLIKGILCLPCSPQGEGSEGFQRAIAKPFGRLRRGETLLPQIRIRFRNRAVLPTVLRRGVVASTGKLVLQRACEKQKRAFPRLGEARFRFYPVTVRRAWPAGF